MLKYALAFSALVALAAPLLAQETRQFEASNGTVEIPVAPQRIVSLQDIGITLPLVEFGATDNIVGSHGRISGGNAPTLRGAADLYGVTFENSDITFVGVFRQIDLETIASLEPDLIIGRSDNDQEILEQLSAIAPTVLLDFESLDFIGRLEVVADVGGVYDAFTTINQNYDALIAEGKRLVPNASEISVAIVDPDPASGMLTVSPYAYALSKVLDDIGFAKPEIIAASTEERFELSPEMIGDIDADFIIATYETSFGTQISPAAVLADFETLVPGFCQFLHACRNDQLIVLPRTPVRSASFSSLEAAYTHVITHIAGRGFQPLQ